MRERNQIQQNSLVSDSPVFQGRLEDTADDYELRRQTPLQKKMHVLVIVRRFNSDTL